MKKITVRGKKILLSDVLETTLSFGVHRSETLENIAKIDPTYITWLAVQDLNKPRLELKIEALVIAMNEGEI